MSPFATKNALAEDLAEGTPRSSSRPTENPVMAAIRRAKPASPEDRARVLDALAEVTVDLHDPSRWMTTEQFMAALARHPEAPR